MQSIINNRAGINVAQSDSDTESPERADRPKPTPNNNNDTSKGPQQRPQKKDYQPFKKLEDDAPEATGGCSVCNVM
jgi:hypothetical protein